MIRFRKTSSKEKYENCVWVVAVQLLNFLLLDTGNVMLGNEKCATFV